MDNSECLSCAFKDRHAALDKLLIRARNVPLTSLQGTNQSINARHTLRNKSVTNQDRRLESKMGASIEDPLNPKGDFPQRERSFWSPGDPLHPFKREDNLRMEGEFTLRRGGESQGTKEIKYFGKEDLMKRADNIKLVGEFSQREKRQWCPGDQVIPCNREDNLRLGGDFGQKEKLKNPWNKGGFCGRKDNLRQNIEVSRNFSSRDEKALISGDRVSLSKMEENLGREGEFCKKEDDILNWKDNITKFGDSVPQREEARWTPYAMVGPNSQEEGLPRNLRAKDNLRLEGEFSQREARGWNPGEKVKPCWRRDNLEMEGEFSKREDVLLQDQILKRFSTRTKAKSSDDEGRMGGARTGVWDRGELVAKVVRPDNLSLR